LIFRSRGIGTTAIRRASSRVSRFIVIRRAGLVFEINEGQRSPGGVAADEALSHLLDASTGACYVRFTSTATVLLRRNAPPLWADFVAKVFLASGRETLIQNLARARNVDSKVHSPRFDYFKFQFHRTGSETFATKSARSGREQLQQRQRLFDHLVGGGEPCRWDAETYALARWSPHT